MFGDVKKVWRATAGRVAEALLDFREPATMMRYRQLRLECQNPDYLVNVLPATKLIYIEVPKAACTTIKLLLSRSLQGPFPHAPSQVHDRRKSRLPTIRQVGVSRFFRIADDPDALIFTFVRSPFERIVSCYRDKVAPFPLSNKRGTIRREIGRFFGNRLNALDAVMPLPFAWFVEMACATARTTRNGHWLAMDRLIPTDAIRCNFVGRVENFDTDILPICDRIGVPPMIKKTNSTGPIRLSDWIDAPIRNAIASAYAEDFDRFEYSTTVPR